MARTDDELLPSEVRARILEEHDKLRERVAELREAAKQVRSGGDVEPFREVARALIEGVRAHLDLEDEILMPTLETIDAWGPERAKRLAAEHESQRAVLRHTLGELDEGGAPLEVVARMEQFADRLEKDMELEERTELDEELLREFPIRTDFGGA
jgi:hemerythrin-like domain-containing protein